MADKRLQIANFENQMIFVFSKIFKLLINYLPSLLEPRPGFDSGRIRGWGHF